MACELDQIIKDNQDDSIDELAERLLQQREAKRIEYLVRQARKTGRYADPSKRISTYIDRTKELIGRRIELENVDDGSTVDEQIKTVVDLGNGNVRINDKYVVNISKNRTSDYTNMVEIYGSEEVKGSSDLNKIANITGTVLESVADVWKQVLDIDIANGSLTQDHMEHLSSVVEMYMEALEKTGKDVEINVDILQDLNERNNTRGEASPETGKMRLILGNQRMNNMTEIMAHELQHVMLKNVLDKNPNLKYEINKLREAMSKEFDWRIFATENTDPNSPEGIAAQKRWEYVFNNNRFQAAEFLAYATTNKSMLEAMQTVNATANMQIIRPAKPVYQKDRNGKYKRNSDGSRKLKTWVKMWNMLVEAINKAYARHIMKGKNAKDMALDLLNVALETEYKVEHEAEKSMYRKVLDKLVKADQKVASLTKEIDKEMNSYEELIQSKEKSAAKKAMDKLWKIKGLAKLRNKAIQNGLFNSITRNTDNEDVSKFYQMFRQAKAFMDNQVNNERAVTAEILLRDKEDGGFGLKNVPEEDRAASKRVLLDTGAEVLGEAKDIAKYLKNEIVLESEIKQLSEGMDDRLINMVDGLVELLVTNKTSRRNVHVNATQIAHEIDDRRPEIIEQIDKLVTLKAIQMRSEGEKQATLNMLEEYEEGMNRILELKREKDAKLLEEAYNNDKMYEVKGATHDVYETSGIGRAHYIVKAKEMKNLVKAGMVNTGKHEELSRILGENMYIVVGDDIEVHRTEGLMSAVQLKNEGDSLRKLILDLNGDMPEAELDEVIGEIVDMESKKRGKTDQALIPERSGNGLIYDYRVRIPHQDKFEQLGLNDDIVATIANTGSSITRKQEAMLQNRAMLNYFKKFYKDYKDNDEFVFVEISEESTGKEKEYWDLIPYYLKKEIENGPMQGKLMVEQHFLVDTFGYTDVSIVNAPIIKNSKRRQVVAKKIESSIEELVKVWKQHLVAFTESVVSGNIISNMLNAMAYTRDPNPIGYMKGYVKYWGMMNDYQELKIKRTELTVLRDSQKGDKSKIQRRIDGLTKRMEEMPIHILLKDGQYTAILEDIGTDMFENKGILQDKLDKLLASKEGSPKEKMKEMMDLIYMRKGTKIHDSVMKLTTYSDIINKAIILEYMLEKNGGKLEQSMLDELDGMHVNYNYLDNRWIKKANDINFLAFTKYYFRILPALVKLAGKRAVSMFLMEGGQRAMDIRPFTPLDAWMSPFDSFANKVGGLFNPMNMLELIFTPALAR